MKPITKSEAAARVKEGLSIETFNHGTMGQFNISVLRQIISRNPSWFPVHHIKFADIKAEGSPELDAAGVVAWLVGQREVCPARCAELTRAQLEDPIINMVDEQGMVFVIDGIHRISERFRRGMAGYRFHAVPVALVPRLQGNFLERPWGEMEVRDGQLLKRQ